MRRVLTLSFLWVISGTSSLSIAEVDEVNAEESEELYSLESLIERANQGDVEVQLGLGQRYDDGIAVEQDFGKAHDWYKKAADEYDSDALYKLGRLYYSGSDGVTQDYAKAVEYFEQAAEEWHSQAQFMLGYMYYKGFGVERDFVKASKWFERARFM